MTRRRFILPILVATALSSPAQAAPAPRGYDVPAVLSGQAPEGSRTMAVFARRRDCGKQITVEVERDGRRLPAWARISCNR